MDKLARSANIVIGVGKLCQAHGLVEKDLPGSLRAILKALQRYDRPILFRFRCLTQRSDLDGIEGALKQCAETNAIKRVLLRADMLQRVRKYDAKLLNILQNFQVCPVPVVHSLSCRANTGQFPIERAPFGRPLCANC